jgi:arylamine N-acetyltransferase
VIGHTELKLPPNHEGQVNSPELDFLRILNLNQEKPTLDFLSRLLRSHQHIVPYENISKLVRRNTVGSTHTSFEEHIDGIKSYGYGGTCYSQNLHLYRLLKFLGYELYLQGNWKEGELTHPNIRVKIDGINYFVDSGVMSTFVGPYPLISSQKFEKQIGNQIYLLTASADEESALLQIFRDGKIIREIKCQGPAPTEKQIAEAVFNTFEKSTMFMTNLVVHKDFGDHSLGLWNRSFYRNEGATHEVTELKDYDDLINAFKRLEMPKAQINEALEALHNNGVQLF